MSAAQGELVILKEGTGEYHRPGCPVIRGGAGVLALTRAQAEARGLKPHEACDPSTSNPSSAAGQRPSQPQPPVTVYLDESKYYHLKSCPKMAGVHSKAVALHVAAKTHWRCPGCKPPIYKRNTEPAIPGTERRRGR